MFKYTFVFYFFLLLSCSKKSESKQEILLPIKDSIENSLRIEKKENAVDVYKYKPSNEFKKLVVDLVKRDLIYDIQRLEKVKIYKELRSENITYFNNYPFYWIPFDENSVFKSKSSKPFNSYLVNLDIGVFRKTKGIWGYFYRDKNVSDVIYDGVIEQWKFDNENQAADVLNELKKEGLKIYFNTTPFFCRIDNDVYVFHTRAMMFSYQQKRIFDKFVKENNAITNYQ